MKKKESIFLPLLHEICPRNLLSFGPDTEALPLERLNVLIGPNGSGKSNLIEAIGLMRATPRATSGDISSVLLRGGGSNEWVWKGGIQKQASIDIKIKFGDPPLRHYLAFRAWALGKGFSLADERIERENKSNFYYRYMNGQPVIRTENEKMERMLASETLKGDLSILAQLNDPEHYPELFLLNYFYENIKIYREWSFGRDTVFREPQRADMRNDRLEEDFSNLGLVLNRLRGKPKAKKAILEGLQDLYQGVTDFDVSIQGGFVQVFFTEGEFTIPAIRLSDGTLRYLCLLAILCDPDPPPLICIEEPELGLHPDILPKLADLLVSASERTQLIVTTHSDILVDAMSERPEAIVVCEKEEGTTKMRRLKKAELQVWLEKYSLGQLWTKGQIGGNRW